jgi:hypothetical protein
MHRAERHFDRFTFDDKLFHKLVLTLLQRQRIFIQYIDFCRQALDSFFSFSLLVQQLGNTCVIIDDQITNTFLLPGNYITIVILTPE